MMRHLRNAVLVTCALIGLVIGAVFFYPLGTSINPVLEQPTDPLPEPFRQPFLYGISETGSDWDVRVKAGQILLQQADYVLSDFHFRAKILAVRLWAFSDQEQSEWFVARTLLPRCWSQGHAELTVAEALYLAARMGMPEFEGSTRPSMMYIAKQLVAVGDPLAQEFMTAANGPLPTCN